MRVAVAVLLLVVAWAHPARAERCVAKTPPPVWFTCFDPGTRLLLSGSTTGVGMELALRHEEPGDDPAVTWRLEHRAFAGEVDYDGRVRGALYGLTLTRHATDGGLVVPTSPPRRLRLPFDLGLTVRVIDVEPGPTLSTPRVGVIRTDAFVDVARSRRLGRRLAIGVAGAYDVGVDVRAFDVDEHALAPLSRGVLLMRAEDTDGLSVLEARAEAGWTWSSATGWSSGWSVEGRGERVLFALNDLPVAAFARAWARSAPPGADERDVGVSVGLSLAWTAPGF